MSESNSVPRTVSASRTGSAEATYGSVAVSGTVVGDINLHTGVPVRTRYREQVLRIAPPDLVGREDELAELAAFCTAPVAAPSYSWWRGKPWAGKSALMAWFVLHPPEKIRIVSFFVTARFASQDERGAFIENVFEQLATLLGEPLPTYATDSTRDAHLMGMLSDAARVCLERGERLVLVVDGLDEDRGVTTGPGAHSIAALLPASPPADMRVIVSGRPNPPIPSDVPQHHPLHDKAIVRELPDSPYAAVVKNDMYNELQRLLLGSQAEQDLLGLLTAARGRLTWQLERELETVTGRSFQARPSSWRPGSRPDVYVLGHEDLQEAAIEFLGAARLSAYQERLHAWADQYLERDWPDETPEYLLRGYYRMLMATGNLERMIACATDRDRHDRMMATSGGDNAAIEEITTALTVIGRSSEPDLASMARLAIIRDYLVGRNTMVPAELPGALAALGQVKRAEALARSVINPGRYALSLVELVRALTADGYFGDAESIARSITDHGRRAEAVMVILNALARRGDIESAISLLPLIVPPGEQAKGFIAVAEAATRAGELEQALNFVAKAEAGLRAVTHPRRRGEALAALAQVVALTGDLQRARSFVNEAEGLIPSIEQVSGQAAVWTAVARALSGIDGRDHASRTLDRAETVVRSISSRESLVRALTSLIRAATAINENSRAQTLAGEAESLIRAIEKPVQRAGAWAALLRAVAPVTSGRTSQFLREGEEAARSVTSVAARASALAVLSRTATMTGEVDIARRLASEAESLTRSVIDPQRRARNLARLARAAAAVGNLDHAEQIARSITSSSVRYRAEALTVVARAVAASGDLEHAKDIAQSIGNPNQHAGALAALAKDAARALNLTEAEEIVSSIASPIPRAEALVELAAAYCLAGDPGRAGEVAASIKPARQKVLAFAALAEKAMTIGAREHAVVFADQAGEAVAASGHDRATMLAVVARAVASNGDAGRSEEIALSIDDPGQQGAALAAIVDVAATAGDVEAAARIAVDIADRYWSAMAQLAIAEALAASGDNDRARNLINDVRSSLGQVSHRNQQDAVLVRLVKLVAATNSLEAAEEIVPEITTHTGQASALIALAQMADAHHASVLVAQAIQLDHWSTSLTELIRVRPDAWPMILAEVARG